MGRTVRHCFTLSFVVTLGWLGARPSRAEAPSPEVKLAVRTYNYAAVPGHILLHAQQDATKIFRRAGIELVWIDCPVAPTEVEKFPACTQMAHDPRALTLKILSETMAARFGLPPSNRGVTFQGHASFVFYRRVQHLSNNNGLSEPVVLGHIVAHELGHLLLGEGAHSENGIMMEDLGVKDFRQAEKGTPLTFSREQAQSMRARLLKGMPATR